MKKILHICSLFGLVILLFSSCAVNNATVDTTNENSRLEELSVGDFVVLPEFGFENDCTLERIDTEDVTGDGIQDNIYLIKCDLDKSAATAFKENYIIVKDGSTGQLSKLGKGSDNEPFIVYVTELQYADVNGDGAEEIIVTEDYCGNGGAGSFGFTVLSFKDSVKSDMFCTDTYLTNDLISYFNISVDAEKITINYSPLKYTRVIEKDDTQKNCHNADVFGISKIQTVDYDNDGIYELLGYRYVGGNSLADCLGYGECVIKYDTQNQEWKVINFKFLTVDEYDNVS